METARADRHCRATELAAFAVVSCHGASCRRRVYASFARMAETGCRSLANQLLLRYFPIEREPDPGALVFVPQAAGFKLASLLDLVWRYHPRITWLSRILCSSFKAIWAGHLRENLDLGLVAGARNPRNRHSIEIPV